MVLKIKAYHDNGIEKDFVDSMQISFSWKYIGGIDGFKVNYHRNISCKELSNICDRVNFNYSAIFYSKVDVVHDDPDPKMDVITICCNLSNGCEYNIILNTIAYVLSDDGKTIDKIAI